MSAPFDRVPATRALAALALAALASCSVIGVHTHNLEVLHDEEGRHRRSGALMGDFEYIVRYGISDTFGGTFGASAKDKDPKPIDDPLGECVENLAGMAEFDPSDARVSAIQVENFARLSTDDPWKLSREISVRALARAGLRLGVEDEAPDPTKPYAGAEEVREVVRRLIQAATPLARGGGSDEEARALATVCDELRALHLDLDGARRSLRIVSVLERAAGSRNPRFAPMRALSVELQKICVRDALLAALRDEPPPGLTGSDPGWPSGRVRAAAVSSCVRVFGDHALAPFLQQLRRESDMDVVLAILDLVEARGLPEPPDEFVGEDRSQVVERWTESIYALASAHPEGRVRVGAMQALGKIAGIATPSLREEDWQDWWLARRTEAGGAANPPATRDAPPGPAASATSPGGRTSTFAP